MRVSETVPFDQYWNDSRFALKRPCLFTSKKRAFGDNIYHRDPATAGWIQEESHHSYLDGCPNVHNIKNDTQTDRVLISNEYVYWGGSGPLIPARFRNWDGIDVYAGRGHKNRFPQEMVQALVKWVQSKAQSGYVGRPLKW
jgi:sarcosine oxidase delta subunit